MAIESLDPLAEKQDRSSTSKADNSKTIDFGGDSKLPPPPQLTAEQEKKLWRKIDMRLMPILSLMYLASFLDRGKYTFLENIVQRDEVAKCIHASRRQHRYEIIYTEKIEDYSSRYIQGMRSSKA